MLDCVVKLLNLIPNRNLIYKYSGWISAQFLALTSSDECSQGLVQSMLQWVGGVIPKTLHFHSDNFLQKVSPLSIGELDFNKIEENISMIIRQKRSFYKVM